MSRLVAVTALWHFTCVDAHRLIGKRGVLMPNPHPLMPNLGPVVWLTSDARPARETVGLTSVTLSCDRMAYRYRACPANPVWWPDIRHRVAPQVVADAESSGQPDVWWLSFEPVPAVLA